ncbi:unnamed protein product [Closterium sp. Naga37s-1]|nr:unnamed protein product [Closterium sp. Naga37s-1]
MPPATLAAGVGSASATASPPARASPSATPFSAIPASARFSTATRNPSAASTPADASSSAAAAPAASPAPPASAASVGASAAPRAPPRPRAHLDVAVYSDADRDALHVRSADVAFRVGPAAARENYLRGDAILDIAERCGAQVSWGEGRERGAQVSWGRGGASEGELLWRASELGGAPPPRLSLPPLLLLLSSPLFPITYPPLPLLEAIHPRYGFLSEKAAVATAMPAPLPLRTHPFCSPDTTPLPFMCTPSEAIHPGYGFLSENADFAAACKQRGVEFIGPPPSAIRAMGDKRYGPSFYPLPPVSPLSLFPLPPVSPLSLFPLPPVSPLSLFPLPPVPPLSLFPLHPVPPFSLFPLPPVPPLAGIRGQARQRGASVREGLQRYGCLVFADKHGNVVHLYERDCSVQRRHQKIIEEAPAPGISEEFRQKICSAAVDAAKVEHPVTEMVTGQDLVEWQVRVAQGEPLPLAQGDLRLSKDAFEARVYAETVEHPVTEMVTGQDLVEWQVRVARGEPLPLAQGDLTLTAPFIHPSSYSPYHRDGNRARPSGVAGARGTGGAPPARPGGPKLTGHAFEARVYAENVPRGFLPAAGPLLHLRTPEPSACVRVETGVQEGDDVSTFYDPMIAKLVVSAANRSAALQLLRQSLGRYEVAGVPTNLALLQAVACHAGFERADVDTHFIQRHQDQLMTSPVTSSAAGVGGEGGGGIGGEGEGVSEVLLGGAEGAAVAAMVCQCVVERWREQGVASPPSPPSPPSPWSSASGFRPNYFYSRPFALSPCLGGRGGADGEGDEGEEGEEAEDGEGGAENGAGGAGRQGEVEGWVRYEGDGSFTVGLADGRHVAASGWVVDGEGRRVEVEVGGERSRVSFFQESTPDSIRTHVWVSGHHHQFASLCPSVAPFPLDDHDDYDDAHGHAHAAHTHGHGHGHAHGRGVVVTPMAGRVVRVACGEGASVRKGDVVVILESMKMEVSGEACVLMLVHLWRVALPPPNPPVSYSHNVISSLISTPRISHPFTSPPSSFHSSPNPPATPALRASSIHKPLLPLHSPTARTVSSLPIAVMPVDSGWLGTKGEGRGSGAAGGGWHASLPRAAARASSISLAVLLPVVGTGHCLEEEWVEEGRGSGAAGGRWDASLPRAPPTASSINLALLLPGVGTAWRRGRWRREGAMGQHRWLTVCVTSACCHHRRRVPHPSRAAPTVRLVELAGLGVGGRASAGGTTCCRHSKQPRPSRAAPTVWPMEWVGWGWGAVGQRVVDGMPLFRVSSFLPFCLYAG